MKLGNAGVYMFDRCPGIRFSVKSMWLDFDSRLQIWLQIYDYGYPQPSFSSHGFMRWGFGVELKMWAIIYPCGEKTFFRKPKGKIRDEEREDKQSGMRSDAIERG